MHEFEPTPRRRFSDCVDELEKLNEQCKELEMKTDGGSETLLWELNPRRMQLAEEVTRQTELLMRGIRLQPFLPDEEEQLHNECVGIAYGKGLFVDGNGSLMYSCAEEAQGLRIGDTLDETELSPFAMLPHGEQEMILRYLKESEETPPWFDPARYGKEV